MKIVTQCRVVEVYCSFKETPCLLLQCLSAVCPEMEAVRFTKTLPGF